MNNWNSPNYSQPSGWGSVQAPFNTNIIYVTSVEEALMRTTVRNSEMVYFHQDRPVFYRVKMDNDGRKMWQEIPYNMPNPNDSLPATKADIENIMTRLQNVESRLAINTQEVTGNVESNG
jgi:hypothetical protein